MSLDDIYAVHDRWRRRWDTARDREYLARKRVEQCEGHLGATRMVSQIADELRPYFPAHRLYVLGPHGLAGDLAIHANDGVLTVGSLTFRQGVTDRLVLVDYARDTDEFPKGTIGERNGLNHPDVDLPADGIAGLVRLLQESIEGGSDG